MLAWVPGLITELERTRELMRNSERQMEGSEDVEDEAECERDKLMFVTDKKRRR